MTLKSKNYLRLLAVCIFVFQFQILAAQKPQSQDSIDSQLVSIVKPYTPKISDAFKLKKTAVLGLSNASSKNLKYPIFSTPVASVFTPAKGISVGLEKVKKVKLFQNYTSIGFGNYGTILANVYLNHKLGRGETMGGYIEHHSSQGGIEGLQLDDSFSTTGLQLNYSKTLKDRVWNTDLALKRQAVNWYGLPYPTTAPIKPEQVYSDIALSTKLQFTKGVVRTGKIYVQRFTDAYSSQEFHVKADTDLQINILDNSFNSLLAIDYLKGSFSRGYLISEQKKYGNVQISAAPSYQYSKGDLNLSIGFKASYLMDSERSINKFYIYPNIKASYSVVNSIVEAYAGLTGELIQNSFSAFTTINPFVSPTLDIRPSSTAFKFVVGTKGKLSQSLGYDVNGSYFREEDKALFRSNSIANNPLLINNYSHGNSFGVVYDAVNVFKLSAALEFDMSQKLNIKLIGELYKYDSDSEPITWNLPAVVSSLFFDYQLADTWSLAGTLFYCGSREDTTNFEGLISPEPAVNEALGSFLDANFQLEHKLTPQWSAFIKVNNIVNNQYKRWNHYPVQGFQLLGGASYKFDF
jgi:hypothetical protein